MRLFFSLAVFLMAMLAGSLRLHADEQHQHPVGDPKKLGVVQFANTCTPQVQEALGRAFAMLHSFWYDETARQFRVVAERDPSCAIAWWGVAMSYWQPLWEPQGPGAEAMKQGQLALERARKAGARSARELAYVAALENFYGEHGKTDHLARVLKYEKAMEALHARYANDTEATVFYALALLGSATSAPADKSYARQRKAGEMLEPIFREQPQHPGLAHYIIHSYDYPPLAGRALEAARSYAKIAPDSPHALHMPSHIFTRLGLWQDSIESNLASAAAARKHKLAGDELHAQDYLVFAYLQTGQDERAQEIAANLPTELGQQARFAAYYALAAIPARLVLERRSWAAAAALTPAASLPGGRYSWADATVHFARAFGAARSGKPEQARGDIQKLAELKQTLVGAGETYWVGQVEIQRRAAAAWLALAEGRKDEALTTMRAAAELEDASDKHPVTPGAVAPAHMLLGDMLIELKRPQDAVAEFQRVLESEPNRFGGIYGAARAARLAGDRKQATEYYTRLVQLAGKSKNTRAELEEASNFLSAAAVR